MGEGTYALDAGSAGLATAPLLVLAEGSTQRCPVFLVHDAYGDLLLYRLLARGLGGRRVLGIPPSQLGSGLPAFTRIEAMAAHYVRLIRQAWPSGPYLLGGLCAGAVIAAEMALLLERAGEQAALVAVLDAADVDARPRRAGKSPVSEALAAPVGITARLTPSWRNVRRAWSGARAKGGALADRAAYLFLDHLGTCPDLLRARLGPRKVYDAAEHRYRPKGRLRGPIFLLRATTGTGNDQPYAELFEDPSLGWRARTTGPLLVSDVPAGHVSLLQAPAVAATAEVVRVACETALAHFAAEAESYVAPDVSNGSTGRRSSPSDGQRQL